MIGDVKFLVISFVLVISGFLPSWANGLEILSPGELMARAEVLDGQKVVVRGYLTFDFEDRNIWESSESRKAWRGRECVSLSNYGRLGGWRKYSGKKVLLEGVVRKDADEGGKVIRLGACNKVAIELIEDKIPIEIED